MTLSTFTRRLGWESGAWAAAFSDLLSGPADGGWARQAAVWAGVRAPMIFVLFAMAIGGLTHPFWDHIATAQLMVRYFEGSLSATDLLAPHNEHRPVVIRLVQLAVARQTGWDLRAEFVLTYTSLLVTFAFLAVTARANVREPGRVPTLALVALSTLIFSPVGHNNLWWSFMFAVTFTAMFAYGAFALTCFPRPRWRSTLCATVLCWLASFSIANGLLTFAVCLLVGTLHATSSNKHRSKHLMIVAWYALHLGAAVWITLQSTSPPRTLPPPTNIVTFVIVFLGAPLEGLVSHPYSTMWDFPRPIGPAAIMGVGALATAVWAVGVSWRRAQRGHVTAMLPIACIAFAAGSGLLIAVGRAAGEHGVESALSSRYTIFATFLYVGLVFAGSAREGDVRPEPATGVNRVAVMLACATLFVMAAAAYKRSVVVFLEARALNDDLARAYRLNADAQAFYDRVYPRREVVSQVKADLVRLRLGPYRRIASKQIAVNPDPSTLVPVALNEGGWVRQRLDEPPEGMCGLRYQLVTWGARLPSGALAWRVVRETASERPLAEGVLELSGHGDWDTLEIPLVESGRRPLLVELRALTPTAQRYGLPTRIMGGIIRDNPAQVAATATGGEERRALPFSYVVCQ